MPAGRDWIDLVKSTFRSVGRADIAGLYALEWQRAKANLTADHREEIDRERRRIRRFLRVANAVLFGLSKRLAPARRVVFGAVLLCVLLALQGPTIHHTSEKTAGVVHRSAEYAVYFDNGFLFVALILLIFLLGMELVDKINFRDELELARDLQASLIPTALPASNGFELGAYNRIANMVGGDIYDFVPLPRGELAILFGDASGHGMTAGLVMAVAHAAFRTQLDVDPAPEAVFATMNRILCRTGGPRAFFGCVYLLLSPDGAFRGSVAGHPPVLELDRAGNIRARIGKGAYPLGIRPTLSWEVETGHLEVGDWLLLYSDGLSESRSRAGEDFGDARIEFAARRWSAAPASAVVTALAEEARAFRGSEQTDDDVSIAVIRRSDAHIGG